MFAAQWGVGEVLWTMFWIFLFIMLIWLIISIFADIVRSDDLGGGAKALWALVVVFIPFLGAFAYLIARGGQMGARAAAHERAARNVVDVSGTDQYAELYGLQRSNEVREAQQKYL